MAAGKKSKQIELSYILKCFQDCVNGGQHAQLVYNGTIQLTIGITAIPLPPPPRSAPPRTTNKKMSESQTKAGNRLKRPCQKRRDKQRFLAWKAAGRELRCYFAIQGAQQTTICMPAGRFQNEP